MYGFPNTLEYLLVKTWGGDSGIRLHSAEREPISENTLHVFKIKKMQANSILFEFACSLNPLAKGPFFNHKPYLFIFSYSVVRLTPSLFAVSDLLPEVISKQETIAARSVSSITSAKVRIETASL